MSENNTHVSAVPSTTANPDCDVTDSYGSEQGESCANNEFNNGSVDPKEPSTRQTRWSSAIMSGIDPKMRFANRRFTDIYDDESTQESKRFRKTKTFAKPLAKELEVIDVDNDCSEDECTSNLDIDINTVKYVLKTISDIITDLIPKVRFKSEPVQSQQPEPKTSNAYATRSTSIRSSDSINNSLHIADLGLCIKPVDINDYIGVCDDMGTVMRDVEDLITKNLYSSAERQKIVIYSIIELIGHRANHYYRKLHNMERLARYAYSTKVFPLTFITTLIDMYRSAALEHLEYLRKKIPIKLRWSGILDFRSWRSGFRKIVLHKGCVENVLMKYDYEKIIASMKQHNIHPNTMSVTMQSTLSQPNEVKSNIVSQAQSKVLQGTINTGGALTVSESSENDPSKRNHLSETVSSESMSAKVDQAPPKQPLTTSTPSRIQTKVAKLDHKERQEIKRARAKAKNNIKKRRPLEINDSESSDDEISTDMLSDESDNGETMDKGNLHGAKESEVDLKTEPVVQNKAKVELPAITEKPHVVKKAVDVKGVGERRLAPGYSKVTSDKNVNKKTETEKKSLKTANNRSTNVADSWRDFKTKQMRSSMEPDGEDSIKIPKRKRDVTGNLAESSSNSFDSNCDSNTDQRLTSKQVDSMKSPHSGSAVSNDLEIRWNVDVHIKKDKSDYIEEKIPKCGASKNDILDEVTKSAKTQATDPLSGPFNEQVKRKLGSVGSVGNPSKQRYTTQNPPLSHESGYYEARRAKKELTNKRIQSNISSNNTPKRYMHQDSHITDHKGSTTPNTLSKHKSDEQAPSSSEARVDDHVMMQSARVKRTIMSDTEPMSSIDSE
ncbi:uncharacterized protein BBOV_IV003610 [Babesia bovis T2Bo]|uniref:Uncharacterized protein n=1 Tax=Babesia bovis TaxID=5865 RepID=A7AVY1_BABBO|nr:uncharacterized protein BBOV_IV003610 [Babesia bovis T2Bo]EDO05957.1 hypothetical protein BBOV_IV003610 [Babesia bovis T2Bo]|eukprot:XP_001609525.1 hypothetical protein [Babesia bovis T2Bo]